MWEMNLKEHSTCDASTEHKESRCPFRFKKPSRKTPGKGGQRYWKNVGLGFKTPKEAIEGTQPGTVQVHILFRELQPLRGNDHYACLLGECGWNV